MAGHLRPVRQFRPLAEHRRSWLRAGLPRELQALRRGAGVLMVDPNRGSVDRGKYMTREEAAAYLGIPFERVKPLIDRGALKSVQRGRRSEEHTSELQSLMRNS